jgi:hypothetical protein
MHYVFDTFEAAQMALNLAETEIKIIASEFGFTVLPNGSVVGKNFETGLDDYNSVTTKWADVIETANGKWCFPSVRTAFKTTYERIEASAGLQDPISVSLKELNSDLNV